MTRALAAILVTAGALAGLTGCFTKPDRVDRDPDAPDARPRVDARPDTACVAGPCNAAGGACEDDVCVIEQSTEGRVTCPTGMPCRVVCSGMDACRAGVDCGGATTCDVRCVGENACRDAGVDCGVAATCLVHCEGKKACEHGGGGPQGDSVECNQSTCEVTCDGEDTCNDGIDVGGGGTCAAHCCDGCAAQNIDPACDVDDACS
jgi:hypothetical protein